MRDDDRKGGTNRTGDTLGKDHRRSNNKDTKKDVFVPTYKHTKTKDERVHICTYVQMNAWNDKR